jgi:hypothetical protein
MSWSEATEDTPSWTEAVELGPYVQPGYVARGYVSLGFVLEEDEEDTWTVQS